MPGVDWLEFLCKHVPDWHEHMVRYYGRYSSRTRGAEREHPEIEEPEVAFPHYVSVMTDYLAQAGVKV